MQLRRSRLADEGAARLAEQRMQDAQQRAVQQQRERQQRDAALQVQPLPHRIALLIWVMHVRDGCCYRAFVQQDTRCPHINNKVEL